MAKKTEQKDERPFVGKEPEPKPPAPEPTPDPQSFEERGREMDKNLGRENRH